MLSLRGNSWKKPKTQKTQMKFFGMQTAQCEDCQKEFRHYSLFFPEKRCPEHYVIDEHRELKKLDGGRTRARKRGLPAAVYLEDWLRTLEHFKFRCAYCQDPDVLFFCVEHVHALSRPGSPGHVIDNVVPACPPCNSLKEHGTPPNLRGVLSYLATIREHNKARNLPHRINELLDSEAEFRIFRSEIVRALKLSDSASIIAILVEIERLQRIAGELFEKETK